MLRRILSIAFSVAGTMWIGANSFGAPTWMDFTGWNHNLVTTVGQTFTNIEPGVDVTITGSPNAFFTTFADGDLKIRTGVNGGSQQFAFSFTAPLNLVVDVESLDSLETLNVSTGGPINYIHTTGALPTIVGDILMSGNGVAFGPMGAARGTLELGTVSSFTWTFASSRPNKYEALRVAAIPVPEPTSLLAIGAMGLVCLRLRRR